MQVLEKILEEIKKKVILVATSKEHYNQPQNGEYVEEVVTILEVEEIIRSHMDDAKDTNIPTDDGWIPVEEQLPEDERMVLVTYMTKSGIPSVDRARFDGKYWRGSGFMGRVIAWQPLPEPYKPKRDISAAGEHIMSRFMKVE